MTVNNGTRCGVSCWRGDPNHTLAEQAKCRNFNPCDGNPHRDANGNNFVVHGDGTVEVVCIRNDARPPRQNHMEVITK